MADAPRPLVVDLDGTLIRSDMLVESFFVLAARDPLRWVGSFFAIPKGKAAFKAAVADGAMADPAGLPYDEEVLVFLREQRSAGRPIHLASAADIRHAEAVAAHVGLFDRVFGSTGDINLAGQRKADRLVSEFGEKGFDYIGNERRDIQVWDHCAEPAVANAPEKLLSELRERYASVREFAPQQVPYAVYFKALRAHQWMKNLLVFVPLSAAHAWTAANLWWALLAFVAFGLAASSAYLINDLTDLPNDRRHPTKRNRPLAAGTMPVKHGLFMSAALIAAAAIVGLIVGPAFLGVLAIYYALTLGYSMALKRLFLIDVMVLAVLYTVRVIAGGVAVGIAVSAWLMAFSMFIFLCLAIVKRHTELTEHAADNAPVPGRAYAVRDLPMLMILGTASGFAAVIVLALYINSPAVNELYTAPARLWLVCLGMWFWVSRLLFLAHRGEVHEDPVVFALTDRTSWIVGAAMAVVIGVSV